MDFSSHNNILVTSEGYCHPSEEQNKKSQEKTASMQRKPQYPTPNPKVNAHAEIEHPFYMSKVSIIRCTDFRYICSVR